MYLLIMAGNRMGCSRAAGIFRVCMSNSSANWCGEGCHLESIIFEVDSPIHGGSGNAYARFLGIGKWTLCAVYLYIYLSITSREKKEKMNTRVHKRVEKTRTLWNKRSFGENSGDWDKPWKLKNERAAGFCVLNKRNRGSLAFICKDWYIMEGIKGYMSTYVSIPMNDGRGVSILG